MRQLVFLAVAIFGLVSHALAGPRVAADIAPVHSLVASVMEGVGEPALIVPR
ncbi:MAG TPA: zinc transporter, partial [Paracoccaceae bacterium]|nr:zinc transporter [Paracoccaceae bacterium]